MDNEMLPYERFEKAKKIVDLELYAESLRKIDEVFTFTPEEKRLSNTLGAAPDVARAHEKKELYDRARAAIYRRLIWRWLTAEYTEKEVDFPHARDGIEKMDMRNARDLGECILKDGIFNPYLYSFFKPSPIY